MNIFIGNPLEVLLNYTKSTNRRSVGKITESEARLFLDMVTDNGNWKCPAVVDVDILSQCDVSTSGTFKLGTEILNFEISSDGTISITEPITREPRATYCHASAMLMLMKMNINVIKELLVKV